MPITYANPMQGYSRTFDGTVSDEHVLLLDLAQEVSGVSLFDRFRSLDPALRNASCVVLRGRTQGFLDSVTNDRLLWSMLKDTPTLALCGALPSGEIRFIRDVPFSSPKFELQIESLRNCEIISIIERNGALFGPTPDEHYDLPSGEHAEAFLRLGQALQDPIEVSRIVDWILPKVKRGQGLIADTGTILPVLFRLQLDAARILGIDIPIRVAERYPADLSVLQAMAHDLFRELGENGQVLFVVSVSSSGRFVQGAINHLVNIPHVVQIVCDTASRASPDALAHLPIKRWPVNVKGECEECPRRNRIYIDSRTYERVFSRQRIAVSITPNAAEKHKKFWLAADKSNAIHLHHDLVQEDGTKRHYGVYLDVPALLTDSWFKSEILESLLKEPRPRIALIPQHATSETVAKLLREAFGDVEIYALRGSKFEPNLVARLEQLSAEDRILIADDGVVSGTTLFNIRPSLQRIYKNSAAAPSIGAFVILARPTRQFALTNLQNRFREKAGTQLRYGYLVFLPEHTKCPWCEERKFLESIAPSTQGDVQEFANARIRKLSGVLESPVLMGSDLADKKARSIGSFFGDLTQPAAFAAASSSMIEQWLQATGDQLDPMPGATKIYCVDVPKIINNYFADAFGPAVLRTMLPRDLIYVGNNEAIYEAVTALDPEGVFPCTVLELLWATAQGKLPAFVGKILLEKIKIKTPEVQMMEQILPPPPP